MRSVVITGGPCSGKSTILDLLSRDWNDRVTIVPEAATLLLSGGWPLPGKDVEWSESWRDEFQKTIVQVQTSLEQIYRTSAQQKGHNLIVSDRGMLDGAAYYDDPEEFFTATGLAKSSCLERYDAVIHLESLASSNPELYSKGNNAFRFESLEEAIPLEHRTRRAWQDHPNHQLILGDNLGDKINQVQELLHGLT